MKGKLNRPYLLLISIHGLIRGNDLELGRDADNGGQTKYVVDLAKSLGESEHVGRVDLVTRLVRDPAVSDDYAKPLERLSDKVRIVRIDDGVEGYLPKEQLWNHLDSFKDSLAEFLTEQGHQPDFVHTHYADAGYVGVLLSNFLGVPLIHTGHSLGRDKRKRLLAQGVSRDQVESVYNISRRIEAEEDILANADLVVTSTHNEIEEQYSLYNYYNPERMAVIPPGTNLEEFYPPKKGEAVAFQSQLNHFLKDPDKPMILALSRPDERKNILTLIEAYGENKQLQSLANLVIVAGTRDDIAELDKGARRVFTNILFLVDKYDLYGLVALPKSHQPDDVPAIYRMAASSQGVFINPALTEPFGLTILEAAATGLPIVATENGGPVDIIANCDCGRLIDPLDKTDMAAALLHYLTDGTAWHKASKNGIEKVREFYAWQAHVDLYLEHLCVLEDKYEAPQKPAPLPIALRYPDRAIFSDLDLNLIGDAQALKSLVRLIRENRKQVSFGVVTGRRIDSALALMRKNHILRPDVLITSLGTRIHYGRELIEDDAWADHIDYDWTPRRIVKLLDNLTGLKRQPKTEQALHKIAYYYDEKLAPSQEEIVTLLRQHEVTANVIFSFGQFMDVIPSRASKGQALRYVANRLGINLEQILVAGGSGADEDMMRGNTLAVVVANRHDEELSQLDDGQRIFFSDHAYASGILEALDYYDFFDTCKAPDD